MWGTSDIVTSTAVLNSWLHQPQERPWIWNTINLDDDHYGCGDSADKPSIHHLPQRQHGRADEINDISATIASQYNAEIELAVHYLTTLFYTQSTNAPVETPSLQSLNNSELCVTYVAVVEEPRSEMGGFIEVNATQMNVQPGDSDAGVGQEANGSGYSDHSVNATQMNVESGDLDAGVGEEANGSHYSDYSEGSRP